MLNDIDAYMIVVKDSEASNYYANYCIPSWKDYLRNIFTYDAVTPNKLKRYKELTFSKYSNGVKYTSKNIKAEITETEKACFYSHFNLWMECCFLQKPIMILEHDTILNVPNNLWYDKNYGIIFYDKAAMGSYIIQPWFAEKLIKHLMNVIISSGPYAVILNFTNNYQLNSLVVNKQHEKFVAVADQVMSKKYGNTIEHYCNLHPEHWPKKLFHKFIEIE